MTWLHWIAGGIAAVCSLYSFRPYVLGIRRGKPVSPSSWVIWAVVATEITVALWFAGGRAQLGLPIAETAGCTLVAVMAWRAAKRRAGRALDGDKLPRRAVIALMAACGVALVGWWFADRIAGPAAGPILAACLLVGVDLTAGGITTRGLRTDPDDEPLSSWWWYGSGELASCGTAIGAGWVFWVSPLSGLAVATAIIATAWVGGVSVSTQRFRGRHAAAAAALPTWLLVTSALVLMVLLGAGIETFARMSAPVTDAAAGTQPFVTSPAPSASADPSECYCTPRQHRAMRHQKRDEYYNAAPPPMQSAAPMTSAPTSAPAPVVSLPGPTHSSQPPTHTPPPPSHSPPPTPAPTPAPTQPSPTPAPDPSPTPVPSPSETYTVPASSPASPSA
jgi:hypothetical protein